MMKNRSLSLAVLLLACCSRDSKESSRGKAHDCQLKCESLWNAAVEWCRKNPMAAGEIDGFYAERLLKACLLPLDPWGNPYSYSMVTVHLRIVGDGSSELRTSSFVSALLVASQGPDGLAGTKDDIVHPQIAPELLSRLEVLATPPLPPR